MRDILLSGVLTSFVFFSCGLETSANGIEEPVFISGRTYFTCVCPDYSVTDDLQDPYLLSVNRRLLTKQLWLSKKPELSEKSKRLKNVILLMNESDSPKWKKRASIMSIMSWVYLNNVDKKPNLCPYAQLVNATLAFERTMDGTAVADALDQLALGLKDTLNMLVNSNLGAGGCTLQTFTLSMGTCYLSGSVYLADDLWQVRGVDMPCESERATRDLYMSSDYTEQMLSLMTTLSLSPVFQEVMDGYSQSALLELMFTQVSPPLPSSCCCTSRAARVKELITQLSSETTSTISVLKTKYNGKKWRAQQFSNQLSDVDE